MLGTISAKVVSPPGTSDWVQAYEFTPDDIKLSQVKGRLFAVLAGGGSAGRAVIDRLHTEYFGSALVSPFEALKNSLQKISSEFGVNQNCTEVSACVFINGVVYSAAFGAARVMIERNGALATILESGLEVVTASGYPKEGDMLLLATKAFFVKIPSATIKFALASGSPNSAAEVFAPVIRGIGQADSSGAIIIKFGNQDEPPKIPVTIAPIVPIGSKISSFFKELGNKLPKRKIYIKSGMGDEVTAKSRKLTFSVGVILLIILVVSIGFGVRQKKINDSKNKYQGILATAQNDVDQAISLASVSPEKSRELFLDSEAKLKEIQSLKIKDTAITDLQNKIQESRGAILGEYDVTPALFLDLGLLSSGFTGNAISASGGNIFVMDKNGKRIVSVEISTKKSKVVAGPSTLDVVDGIASYQNTVYVLSSDGIYQVGTAKTKVIEKTWAGEAFISSFAGNIYVLDKSGNAVYRYSGQSDNTFGAQQNWLSASTKPNFSNAFAWGMDGAIYVLYPNAKILKYSLGSPQNFSLFGVTPEIGNIDALYADPDNQYLYLLDRAGKRVVAVDKKGNYKAQYTSDQIAGAVSLVVSEAQKEIILLTGDKLLSIGIK